MRGRGWRMDGRADSVVVRRRVGGVAPAKGARAREREGRDEANPHQASASASRTRLWGHFLASVVEARSISLPVAPRDGSIVAPTRNLEAFSVSVRSSRVGSRHPRVDVALRFAPPAAPRRAPRRATPRIASADEDPRRRRTGSRAQSRRARSNAGPLCL